MLAANHDHVRRIRHLSWPSPDVLLAKEARQARCSRAYLQCSIAQWKTASHSWLSRAMFYKLKLVVMYLVRIIKHKCQNVTAASCERHDCEVHVKNAYPCYTIPKWSKHSDTLKHVNTRSPWLARPKVCLTNNTAKCLKLQLAQHQQINSWLPILHWIFWINCTYSLKQNVQAAVCSGIVEHQHQHFIVISQCLLVPES